MNIDELRAKLRAATEKRNQQLAERGNVLARVQQDPDNAGQTERLRRVDQTITKADDEIRELEAEIGRKVAHDEERMAVLREAAKDPTQHETPGRNFTTTRRVAAQTPVEAARNDAMRALEVEVRHDRMPAEAAEHVERVISRDSTGIDGRYITAHADPNYATAFGKIIAGRSSYEMTPAEQDAVRMAMEANRAMTLGGTAGYGVPVSLDPSIILTSNGQANPLRELATVTTISTSEWAGVASAGVTASFVAEGTEATDNSPTLTQPTITPERAQAFVPYSIEAGSDWAGLQAELTRLFAEAKDALEADKYTNGAGHGSEEPEGIITGATSTVAAGTASFAVAHVYKLQEQLPARYQANARFLSSLPIRNTAYRLVASADTDEPSLFGPDGSIAGKPWSEVSNMPTASTTGNGVFVYGDIAAGSRIVDRIGLSVELIPHLFGTTANLPTGMRGLYAYWRTSSAVVNANALRVLETT